MTKSGQDVPYAMSELSEKILDLYVQDVLYGGGRYDARFS